MANLTLGSSCYFPPSLSLHWNILLLPKTARPELSCTWSLQNTGLAWHKGLTSLLGTGQLLCKAALSYFKATVLLEKQVNAQASLQKALPRLWLVFAATCSPAFHSAWETPPIAIHSVCLAAAGCQIPSTGMDFQAVAFIPFSSLSNLCLKEFSPLASSLFAGKAEPLRCRKALDAWQPVWPKIQIQGTFLGGIFAGKSKGK